MLGEHVRCASVFSRAIARRVFTLHVHLCGARVSMCEFISAIASS